MVDKLIVEWKIILRKGFFAILIGISGLIAGCVSDPIIYGPPPHAHYYPDDYDYYFYPAVRVYFHFSTGYYYYLDGTRWVRSRVLPPRFHIDSHSRVKIRIESEKPYIRVDEHVRLYKPKPSYRFDRERSVKEREANKTWFQELEKKKARPDRRPMDKEDMKDKGKPGRY